MRQNLAIVPVYLQIGRVSASVADLVVAAGHGHSLKGKALLLIDVEKVAETINYLDEGLLTSNLKGVLREVD